MGRSICVFCASSDGVDDAYAQSAIQLGEAIAKHGDTLIYGGGTSGLMGVVAAACLNAGGSVHGVIPAALQNRERFFTTRAHLPVPPNLLNPTPVHLATPTDKSLMSVVQTMHERKTKMASMADAFVALPGGFGTLEEVGEMTTWNQLKIHSKPMVLLNVNEFYTPLRDFVNRAVESGFIAEKNRDFMVFVDAVKGKDWGQLGVEVANKCVTEGTGTTPYQLEWS